MEFDETPSELSLIEKEIESPQRKRHGHPSHRETNMLTASEERSRRRRKIHSKSKKYDGRGGKFRVTADHRKVYGKEKMIRKPGTIALPRVREALEGFYKEVELPELKQALAVSNDPRYNMLLAAINNPRLNGCSFSDLCRRCKMSIQDVVEVWRNHLKAKGMVRMMTHIPDVMEDVAVDSKSRTVMCDLCQGKGKLMDKEVNRVKDPICPECHGDGVVRLMGDKGARELAFETVGLKKGGGGVTVSVSQQVGVPSMEDQIANIDKVFDAEYTELTPETIKENGDGTTGNDVDGNEGRHEGTVRESGEAGEPGGSIHSTPPEGDAEDGGFNDPLPPKPDPTDYSS